MLISSRILHFSSSVRTLPRSTLLLRFDTFRPLKFIIQIMDCWMWWIFLHLRIEFSIKLYKIVNYKLVSALHTRKFFPPAATARQLQIFLSLRLRISEKNIHGIEVSFMNYPSISPNLYHGLGFFLLFMFERSAMEHLWIYQRISCALSCPGAQIEPRGSIFVGIPEIFAVFLGVISFLRFIPPTFSTSQSRHFISFHIIIHSRHPSPHSRLWKIVCLAHHRCKIMPIGGG